MANLPAAAKDAIDALVRDLVHGRFASIQGEGRAGRLTADELELAVSEYGRTLVDLPEEAWHLAEVAAVSRTEMSVDVPLWTSEEGRSDLTLFVSIRVVDGRVHVSVDDLHVL